MKTHQQLKEKWMKDPEFKAEYDALEPEFAALEKKLQAQQEPITKVIFRWWKKSVIAIFIEEPGTNYPGTCDSYQHIGQHGACDPSIISDSRPATEEEYASLKHELESYPYHYNLRVLKRSPNRAIDARRQKIEAMAARRQKIEAMDETKTTQATS